MGQRRYANDRQAIHTAEIRQPHSIGLQYGWVYISSSELTRTHTVARLVLGESCSMICRVAIAGVQIKI